MRIYETTFVVNPQTDDAALDREVQSVSELITKNGGKVLHQNRLGTRRLAYQLQGLTQGFYSGLIFEANPNILSLLDKHFKLGEAYLRHLTVLCERDIKALLEPKEADTPSEVKAVGRPAAAVKAPTVKAAPRPPAERETPKPAESPAEAVQTDSTSKEPDKRTGIEEDEQL